MKRKYERTQFIKAMEETPFVSYAAKKSGISRATIYRWLKSNPEFRKSFEDALDSGRKHLIDVAEMSLIERIKTKDLGAIKFFLQHNDKRYRPMRTRVVPESDLPGKPRPGCTCKVCGVMNYDHLSEEKLDERIKELRDAVQEDVEKNKDKL